MKTLRIKKCLLKPWKTREREKKSNKNTEEELQKTKQKTKQLNNNNTHSMQNSTDAGRSSANRLPAKGDNE